MVKGFDMRTPRRPTSPEDRRIMSPTSEKTACSQKNTTDTMSARTTMNDAATHRRSSGRGTDKITTGPIPQMNVIKAIVRRADRS
jgi:hypothetical protein